MKYFYFFITFLILLLVIFSPGVKESNLYAFINVVIAIICSIGLFSYEKNPFSLFKLFIIFFLFFFCIAPVLQFKNDVHLLGTVFQENDYIQTSTISLFILILFILVYVIYYSKLHIVKSRSYTSNKPVRFTKLNVAIMLILSICVCLIMLWMNNFNILSLFVRGGETKTSMEVSNITSLILSNFLRPIPMIIFISALIFGLRNKIVLSILFLSIIFSCPPTGVERFTVAAIYLPVLLQIFPFLWRKNVFVLVLTFGLLVIFPALNNFRYYDANTDFVLALNFDQFLDLHFDSFSMFMRVLKDGIITYGRQLLGVFFFWVPRGLWPDKPVGSGYYVAETTGLSFNNISMPIFGEGYINFGFIGVILFTVLLALFASRQDYLFWNKTVAGAPSWDKIKYYIFIGMFLFILRGDLMSSFAFLCGYIIAFMFVKLILSMRIKTYI